MGKRDYYTNTPEDAGRYDRHVFGDQYPDDRPTRAEAEADERDND